MKIALVFGITGQDGSYLAQFLTKHDYQVYGVMRRTSTTNTYRLEELGLFEHPQVKLYYGDINDPVSVWDVFDKIYQIHQHPIDEIYNLAAMSHVGISFQQPNYTIQVDGMGPLHVLETIRKMKWISTTKYYQASTSEMFGNAPPMQSLNTPFNPASPYACAKLMAHHLTRVYREGYGMFTVNGILFNHESPFRAVNFVTRKVTRTVARIKKGKAQELVLGNLTAKRDWGYAPDYVEGMWQMMQYPKPRDWILATGQQYTVQELVEKAFDLVDIKLTWSGKGLDQVGKDEKGQILVRVDSKYFRPFEVENLWGDATETRQLLKWSPRKSFDDMIQEMVNYDLQKN